MSSSSSASKVINVSASTKNNASTNDENWLIIDIDKNGNVIHLNGKKELRLSNSSEFLNKDYKKFIEYLVKKPYQKEVLRLLHNIFESGLHSIEFFSELNLKKDIHALFQVKASSIADVSMTILITKDTDKKIYRNKITEARLRSMRVIEYANLLIVRIAPDYKITDILGNAEDILGMKKSEMVNKSTVWKELFGQNQARKLLVELKNSSNIYQEISTEVKLLNKSKHKEFWFLLRATPLYSRYGEFLGWEGFGIDISDKKRAEKSIVNQNIRIQSLYEVSSVLHGGKEPALVALNALDSLVEATGSDAGYIAFYNSEEELIEVVASKGLSLEYLRQVQNIFAKDELSFKVINSKVSLAFKQLSDLKLESSEILEGENIVSGMLAPLNIKATKVKTTSFGLIALFKKTDNYFSRLDFDILRIASKQIALVVKQAEYQAVEKERNSNLETVYNVSQELALPMDYPSIANVVFDELDKKVNLNSLWLGLIDNETKRLVTKAYLLEGEYKKDVSIGIKLNRRASVVTKSFRDKIIRYLSPSDFSGLGELGQFYKESNSKSLITLPLIALGKVMGLLVIEPKITNGLKRKDELFKSISSEIATVILSRRVEEREVYSEKMRLAGMLSSGVAHNFNNMLQAVLGQASIIEMQSKDNKKLNNAAKEIIRSANKGAKLIQQMLSFSDAAVVSRENFSFLQLIRGNVYEFRKLIKGVGFKISYGTKDLIVKGDRVHILQVIKNLINNSSEALKGVENPRIVIKLSLSQVSDRFLINEIPAGNYAVLSIEDNGKGMNDKELKRCFEPFFTSKKHKSAEVGFNGSGLGLAFSLAIARQHGGTIIAESEVGKGSVFSLYLPLSDSR